MVCFCKIGFTALKISIATLPTRSIFKTYLNLLDLLINYPLYRTHIQEVRIDSVLVAIRIYGLPERLLSNL